MSPEYPFLSIAIATYNRKEKVLQQVRNLLKCPRNDIEVVVTDNASMDGTVDELLKIRDDRLKIICKKENSGAPRNWIDAVFNCNGQYIIYTNDRDYILMDKIPKLIEILQMDNWGYVITKNDDEVRSGDLAIYETGFEALLAAPISYHPSGRIYNGQILREHLDREYFYQYEDTTFPEGFIARSLACYGKGGIYDEAIYHNDSQDNIINCRISPVASRERKDEDYYMHPSKTWLLVEKVYKQLFGELPLTFEQQQRIALIRNLSEYISGRLISYKRFRSTKATAQHYNLTYRSISNREIYMLAHEYFQKWTRLLKSEKAPLYVRFEYIISTPYRWYRLVKACHWVENEIWKKGKV